MKDPNYVKVRTKKGEIFEVSPANANDMVRFQDCTIVSGDSDAEERGVLDRDEEKTVADETNENETETGTQEVDSPTTDNAEEEDESSQDDDAED